MKASELGPWRAPLGAALAAFWVGYYFWLAGAQPAKDELLRSSHLPPGITLRYAQAPPWPAVEWNMWPEWRGTLHMQAAYYGAFLVASRCARAGAAPAEGRGCWALAAIGITSCAFLRGILGAVLTLAITAGVHFITTALPSRVVMPVAWLYTILLMQWVFRMLVVDSSEEPCRLEQLFPALSALPPLLGVRGVGSWSMFRYDALRLISFAGDVAAGEAPPGLAGLLAYQLYPPLAPAGPVLRYADFLAQLRAPRRWPRRDLATYLLRTLGLLLVIEASLYVLHFPAWFGPATPREELLSMSPWVLFGAIHWVLQFEWLSLTAVWRVPRLVALLDGIEAPEDMLGPVWSPRGFQGVWRLWHASLNLWGVRYIYRPLGGRRSAGLAVPATFLFVAFWHDIRGLGDRPWWYAWAALNSGFLLLEASLLGRRSSQDLPVWCVAVSGVNAVLALIISNLPALIYKSSFTVIGAILLREGSGSLMLVLALVFGAGAVLEASCTPGKRNSP